MLKFNLSKQQIDLLIIVVEPVLEDWEWSPEEKKSLTYLLFKLKSGQKELKS
jgi:hypothetical protein